MKDLELQELTFQEMEDVNGGSIVTILVFALVGVVVGAVTAMLLDSN